MFLFRTLGLAGSDGMLFFSRRAAWGTSDSDPLWVIFRVPFSVAFWALYEPRNTMDSKGFGDFREVFWFLFRLIFGPGLHGFMTGPAGLGGVGSGQNCRRMFFFRSLAAAGDRMFFFAASAGWRWPHVFFSQARPGPGHRMLFFRSQKYKIMAPCFLEAREIRNIPSPRRGRPAKRKT